MLNNPQRLSIDVDIITQTSKTELESVLDKVSGNYGFNKYELDTKRSYQSGIPKAHYHFLYDSSYHPGGVNYIMLDVLFESSPYEETKEIKVESMWFKTTGEATKLLIPSENSILGDKLTAYAPNTTGILHNLGKEMEIIKQLFDVGVLFEKNTNFQKTKLTFDKVVAKEIEYRGNQHSSEQVLEDIIETSLILAKRDKQDNQGGTDKYKELMNGILQFQGNLLYGKYRLDNAIESSSKAAYLAAKMKVGDSSLPEKFDDKMNVTDFLIEEKKYSFLNKLKKLPSNSALFYWNRVLNLIK